MVRKQKMNKMFDYARTVSRSGDYRPDIHCNKCNLQINAINVCITSWGSEHPTLLLVGEAPGRIEDVQGYAFTGPSGCVLHDLLEEGNIPLAECRFSNIVRCLPFKETGPCLYEVVMPSEEEVEACHPYILAEIAKCKPKLVVALGSFATNFFLNTWNLDAVHGQMAYYKFSESNNELCVPVLATSHPAALIQAEQAKSFKKILPTREMLVSDLMMAYKLATGNAEKANQLPEEYWKQLALSLAVGHFVNLEEMGKLGNLSSENKGRLTMLVGNAVGGLQGSMKLGEPITDDILKKAIGKGKLAMGWNECWLEKEEKP